MKLRSGFVSNSSSCSFIVKQDLSDKGIVCLKIEGGLKDKFLENHSWLDPDEDYWLTQYMYDGGSKIQEITEEINANPVGDTYSDGEMSENPYCEEYYVEYPVEGDTSVYVKREDSPDREMTVNAFCKELKKRGNIKMLVKTTEAGYILEELK